ncbi:hypothetical protein N1851_014085 [Merluccius polli]|uniref:Endonuclease/exonuclease/phosphatase domain-containing protein n=1 Tax=Merluccius polli TaxID=89951 RepID=A0AA47P159_MERPO|nr:hypothetical protein N1851_014085 [Merluccius polli]
MPEEPKHPAILAKDLQISDIILQHIHQEARHGGRNHMKAGREDGRKKSYRIKISAQKGLELLQQHPALKDQTKLKTRNWNLGTWYEDDVVLKDTIQAAAWCQLQSFKDSVSLPEVIGMEGWEQMAASTERKSDDGGDEEKTCKKIKPFQFSFRLHTDYELFSVEMMDRRNLKVFASFESNTSPPPRPPPHDACATRLQCSLMMQHNGGAWQLWRRRKRRGARGGLLNRHDPHRPSIPSLFLANVRSLANKMDEMRLRVATKTSNSCAFLLTESWLTASIPDASIEIQGYTIHRQDRNKESTGKSRGGGVVIYLNNNWTSDSKLVSSHCSQDLEYITVKCRPFHLAREHSAVFITVVYIAPDANASIALAILHNTISAQQSKYPHAVHITVGDFNQTNLKTVLPKLYQHVKCATRGDNTLDKVYTNIKNGYRAKQLPQLAQSDHMSLLLIPAYTPIRKSAPITIKTVKTWPEGAMEQLQNCFEITDWSVFENRTLNSTQHQF